ncbi:MAG: element excision factor XisH family protein [Acidobacteriota bacterium]
MSWLDVSQFEKTFSGASKLQELKEALGQYDIYLYLLEATEPDLKLYVAVSEKAYREFFAQEIRRSRR